MARITENAGLSSEIATRQLEAGYLGARLPAERRRPSGVRPKRRAYVQALGVQSTPSAAEFHEIDLGLSDLAVPQLVCVRMGHYRGHALTVWSLHGRAGSRQLVFQGPNMIYWAKLVGGADNPNYRMAGNAFGAIGSLHFLAMLWILKNSLREKSSCSDRPQALRSVYDQVFPATSQASAASKAPLEACGALGFYVFNTFRRWFWIVFSLDGILGVRSPFFFEVFAVREVASQTDQANRCSNLVPRRWINNLMISLLIFNCWSTPILRHLLHRKPALERIACVILDTVLGIGSNYFIPLAVFLPYYFAFDMAIFSFPNDMLYDMFQFTRLVTESRMVFTLSLLNLFSKAFSYLSIFKSILTVTALLDRRRSSIAQSG